MTLVYNPQFIGTYNDVEAILDTFQACRAREFLELVHDERSEFHRSTACSFICSI